MPELTKKDLEKIRQELDHRRIELRPQLLEAVKEIGRASCRERV
mgnify:CR=1 FL=1